jgi:hypothetical protein
MIKRFTSLTLFWSALVLFFSSVVLFIEPHGRVAFWADWRLLGLTKQQWDDLHICSGTLFLLASLVHIWLNWPLITAYLTRRFRGASSAPVVWGSLAVVTFITVGTWLGLPPMKQFLALNEAIKESHTKRYGNPPFGHAELVPVEKLARFLGVDPKEFISALEEAGIRVGSARESLKEIGEKNGMSPSLLFDLAMKGLAARGSHGTGRLPRIPPPGTGKLTIADLSATYHIPQKKLIERLNRAGITAKAGQSLREIAISAGKTAPEIYEILRGDEDRL